MVVEIAALVKGIIDGVGSSVVNGIDAKKRREYEIVLSSMDRRKQEKLEEDLKKADSNQAKLKIIQDTANEAANIMLSVEQERAKQKAQKTVIIAGVAGVLILAVTIIYVVNKRKK